MATLETQLLERKKKIHDVIPPKKIDGMIVKYANGSMIPLVGLLIDVLIIGERYIEVIDET